MDEAAYDNLIATFLRLGDAFKRCGLEPPSSVTTDSDSDYRKLLFQMSRHTPMIDQERDGEVTLTGIEILPPLASLRG